MKRTILKPSDFADQAATILAASKARRADLRMEVVDGDEDKDAPDAGDGDSDDADDDQDSEPDDDGDDKDSKDDDKDSKEDKVDRSEYERVKRHRAAADRKNADLQRQIDELKRGQVKDDDKKDKQDSSESDSLRMQLSERDSEIHTLRIQNAFLAANEYTWHDAGDALRLADLSDVEIEEDGTVVGLKEALQKLAKEKPHLIKKSDSSDDDKGKKGPSGSSNNGKRKGQQTKPDRAALSKTYPVLANRR